MEVNFKGMSFLLKYTALLCLCLAVQSVNAGNSDLLSEYVTDVTAMKQGRFLLGALNTPLSEAEEAQCLKFLRHTFSAELADYGRTRQNDLADWLLYQPQHVNACAEVILEVIKDESADIRWREFCLQKLPLALEQPALRQDLADACLSNMLEKAGDPRISFSGTALLRLYRASIKDKPLIQPEKVASLAEHVLREEEFPNANKVTALQIAGLSGSRKAVSLARQYVREDAIPTQLRVSAIALLGKKGDKDDLPSLIPFTRNLDFRLRKAAEAAVSNLTS